MGGAARRRECLQIEELQPRLFFSAGPVGGAVTPVNTSTTPTQETPAAAMNRSGQYAIAWASAYGTGWTVQAREYSAGGTGGTQFQVSQSPATTAPAPSVSLTAGGNTIVTWNGGGGQVFVREFNSSGAALAGQELVTHSEVNTSPPTVASAPDGSFLVAWEGSGPADSDGIYAQRFTAAGLATGGAFLLNTASSDQQMTPSLAADASGNYAAVWADPVGAGSISGVTVSASGSLGSQFLVTNTGTPGTPAIASDGAGSLDIVWIQSTNGKGIYERRYSVSAAPLGSASKISSMKSFGSRPAVAARVDGEFAVAWTDGGGSSGNEVYGDFFDASGNSVGYVGAVNTTSAGDQQNAVVAFGGGNAVFAWDGDLAANPQTVYQRSFAVAQANNAAPVNTVPGSQNIGTNAPLTFSAANGNVISVSDADAYGASEQVTLTTTHGTLSLSGTAGLTFTAGTGSGDATMTFAGTLSAINTALSGLTFTPTSNYTGSASVQIASDDLGNTGTGGPLTTTNSVAIGIAAAGQPANNVIPGTQTATENTALSSSPPQGAICLKWAAAGNLSSSRPATGPLPLPALPASPSAPAPARTTGR